MAKIAKVKRGWRELVLVCRKCTRKARGGFGRDGSKPLGKVLRKELGIAKGRKGEIGFIEVGCFGICPRRRVTLALGSDPGSCRVIPCGTPAKEIIEALDLARHVKD